MVPRPLGISAVPVAASVMGVYWQLARGKDMMGFETSDFKDREIGFVGCFRQWATFVSRILADEFGLDSLGCRK
jgi:hypothetical protein